MVVDQRDPTTGERDREAHADRLFAALADATRRDIVRQAMGGRHSVSSLADRYPMSFAAVQKHVAVLERAGLVKKERVGREQLVRTDVETLRTVHALLDQLEARWRDRIERFGEVLADPDGRNDR
jgi:DNA-binding transcriptional ArsR family regulator